MCRYRTFVCRYTTQSSANWQICLITSVRSQARPHEVMCIVYVWIVDIAAASLLLILTVYYISIWWFGAMHIEEILNGGGPMIFCYVSEFQIEE